MRYMRVVVGGAKMTMIRTFAGQVKRAFLATRSGIMATDGTFYTYMDIERIMKEA